MDFLPQIVGSFADPAAENPTVEMVEAAFRHHDLHWRYVNCEVPADRLAAAVAGARAMGWAGFNCSLPHKVTVIEYLDGLGESARLIGAVNCVVRDGDGRFIGENTDGKGFLRSLEEVTPAAGKRVVIFGAGGAARAIAVELALAGAAKITVINRTRERGQELVQHIGTHTGTRARFEHWRGVYRLPEPVDVAINATSIGLFPDVDAELPLDLDSLRPSTVVADVIPNPPRTRLIEAAAARGCTVLDGLGMLVNQGVSGIRYWTGVEVNHRVMRARLEAIFG
ncbi:MAG: shikimate dehydrogenase [Holophagales bacterium]|nr:shikimate dehydrogenase [Holophagales bacterium]MYD21037.1 shikimate dehydrogenase [Holophagales bacterium]MYI33203.1 shikimate dehydrogenase [Holophagales bacterium]